MKRLTIYETFRFILKSALFLLLLQHIVLQIGSSRSYLSLRDLPEGALDAIIEQKKLSLLEQSDISTHENIFVMPWGKNDFLIRHLPDDSIEKWIIALHSGDISNGIYNCHTAYYATQPERDMSRSQNRILLFTLLCTIYALSLYFCKDAKNDKSSTHNFPVWTLLLFFPIFFYTNNDEEKNFSPHSYPIEAVASEMKSFFETHETGVYDVPAWGQKAISGFRWGEETKISIPVFSGIFLSRPSPRLTVAKGDKFLMDYVRWNISPDTFFFYGPELNEDMLRCMNTNMTYNMTYSNDSKFAIGKYEKRAQAYSCYFGIYFLCGTIVFILWTVMVLPRKHCKKEVCLACAIFIVCIGVYYFLVSSNAGARICGETPYPVFFFRTILMGLGIGILLSLKIMVESLKFKRQ